MKKWFLDFFDVIKYKRLASKYKNNYDCVLENKLFDYEKIIRLQDNIINLQNENAKQKDELLKYKNKDEKEKWIKKK